MTVQKYRKKPVVIEAIQLPPVPASIFAINMLHDWVKQMREEGVETFLADAEVVVDHQGIHIPVNTGGTAIAAPGDWIIKGVEGEFYPCPDSVFQATYELEDTEHGDEPE